MSISRPLGASVIVMGLLAPPAAAAPAWFPAGPLVPRALADPLEPRIGITYAPDPDRFDAMLGAPLPLVEVPLGSRSLMVILEAGVGIRLERDGSFFPLATTDGFFGLGLETRRGPWSARLRLMHHSAHKADGDSTVAYREPTFSREYGDLQVAHTRGSVTGYLRIGGAWHAVPRDRGLDLAGGAVWRGRGTGGRPFAALHLEADAERSWRLAKAVRAGWELGSARRVRLGLRAVEGRSVPGQYWNRTDQYLGVEIEFDTFSPIIPGDRELP
jgi:hypothetical protein